MAYKHNDALYKHRKRALRLRKFAFIFGAVFILATGFIASDWVLTRLSTNNTVVSREINSTVQSASINLYRTEYYQFQATDEWLLEASKTKEDKFVYLRANDLSSQRLIVYVNRPLRSYERDHALTNVVPVELTAEGKFANIGEVSDHCENSWPEGLIKNPTRIEHNKVSFVCTPGSREYNVVVGEYDGDEAISATMDDGTQITFTIVFSDFSAYPNAGELKNILSNFTVL